MYELREVSGAAPEIADALRYLNSHEPTFPPLTDDHLANGFWWLIESDETVGFTGMVPFLPFAGVGYLKRCYVNPLHRGNGLQIRSLFVREARAKKLGWKQLVSETTSIQSAGNFVKAGYEAVIPEQKWGAEGSMFFAKTL
jgi:hypothetical protein